MASRWLPGQDQEDPWVLGLAFYLEDRFFDRMKVAVQNAIAAAFPKR